MLKPLKSRPGKKKREEQILFALVEYYIQTGKPVGSTTLKESEFDNLSSATIRNYFMKLEKAGYLSQQHSSAGRIPTNSAFKVYAKKFLEAGTVSESIGKKLRTLRNGNNREISSFLQHAAELLGKTCNYPVFLSAPRFDHDFVSNLKIVSIDQSRYLCILITDFGLIKTELLHTTSKLNSFSLKRIEAYFHWRLTEQDEPTNLTEDELSIAQKFYNEVMIRYIVGYSNFSNEDLYWTEFSQLLSYPEFADPLLLASSLALFENSNAMRHLLRECTSSNCLKFWLGDDLTSYSPPTKQCTTIAIPYYINKKPVGSVAILGPIRIPYREIFGILRLFSQYVSEALTKDIYKFKITYRQPQANSLYLEKEESSFIEKTETMLLEDKSSKKT